MRERLCGLTLLVVVVGIGACAERLPAPPTDPIPDIPIAQQRVIERSDLDWQWPFMIGKGTLGCVSDAVIFRYEGRNYAMNDAASKRGFGPPEPIWRWPSPGPPSNPLRRINQDQRQKIFAESMSCDGSTVEMKAAAGPCKNDVRNRWKLSAPELVQVEAEGQERLWSPLERKRATLEPLIEIGLKLCPR